MVRRLTGYYNNIHDGFNNGLITGGLIVFLILIGLPAGLPGREPLAPLALPAFVLLSITFAVVYVRQNWERAGWSRLIQNAAALGIGTALVLGLVMSLINNWQADPTFNVQEYFAEVTLETTSRLSGVAVQDLHPNPPVDPLTQEFPEDAELRTNPMPLRIDNDDISVFNLGFVQIGGIWGTALVLAVIGFLTVPIYRAILLVDWDRVRENRREFLERPLVSETLHWVQLLLPIFLFVLFIMTIRMNYNTPFWRDILGEHTLFEMAGNRAFTNDTMVSSPILDLQNTLRLGGRATQNFQLILAFSMIIALMVAMRNARYRAYRLFNYPVRLAIIGGILLGIFLLVMWRIQGSDVAYIVPTILGDPNDKLVASLIVSILITGLLALYAVFSSSDPSNFEASLVLIPGIAMLLAMPLFMDQYQTSVLNIVAINTMLGLGLNIVVGYAGLLDLGYVAFFAIGAYTYAFVESNRQQIEVSVANELFYNFLTALFIVPLVVFGTTYLWQRRNHTVSYDGRDTDRFRWTNLRISPTWYAILMLIAGLLVTVNFVLQIWLLLIGTVNLFLLVPSIAGMLVVMYVGFNTFTNQTESEIALHSKEMRPLWREGPPWLLSLLLVIFAIAVALGSTWLLSQTGVFEEAGRASPFMVGLLLALMASAAAGVLLGFPVLRLRSDYLAIVTLGFGEIISIALENLEGLTGGAFGADGVPKPLPAGSSVAEANLAILYLAIIGSAGVAVLSMRLRSSRLGRSWMALRSDEDIAQAMGVNLVNSKLLAFAIGASFAGAAGLLFASRQANIRPPNFNLDISINVLSLVIIGGMGSIPGVVIGAIALVGLPEMLRALAEYRILVFGALLVVMMLVRPQGLLPKPVAALEERARQLRERGVESKGILSEEADDEQ